LIDRRDRLLERPMNELRAIVATLVEMACTASSWAQPSLPRRAGAWCRGSGHEHVSAMARASPPARGAQRDGGAAHVDGDAPGLALGVALERLLDARADAGRGGARAQRDLVAHADHADQRAHRLLGARALGVPIDLAAERDPAVLDGGAHTLGRQAAVPPQRKAGSLLH
jgi:hypothetical protein